MVNKIDAVVDRVGMDPGALGSKTKLERWALSEEDAAQKSTLLEHLAVSASHELHSWNDSRWLEVVHKLGGTEKISSCWPS